MFSSKRKSPIETLNYSPIRPIRLRTPFWAGDITKTYLFKFLKRMEATSLQAAALQKHDLKHRPWPLAFRRELREIFARYDSRANVGEMEIVRLYLLTCPPSMIPICVWMIGRFGGPMPLRELKSLRHSLSPQLRRHLAKALRRLSAWPLLREMAIENPNDDRIQWFATAPSTHRPFAERLNNFKSIIDHSHADEVRTPSQMPFWARDHRWYRTPPKSLEMMRRILRRIQQLVHRGAN
jgi:hypothetical protein